MIFLPLILRRILPLLALAALLLAAAAGFPQTSSAPAESLKEDALSAHDAPMRGRFGSPDAKAALLEQPPGRAASGFQEEILPWIAGLAILFMLIALAAASLLKRPGGLAGADRSIRRFRPHERFAHGLIAVSFLVQAVTGLNFVFGKRLLLPILSPDAFAAWSQWSKILHAMVAWSFMLGWLLVFLFWVRDNRPGPEDGGRRDVGGRRAHAGPFDAGQKIMFWSVFVGAGLMIGSGLALMFPFSALDVGGMPLANGFHALIAVFFIAGIVAHIFIGSLGMEGAFEPMETGDVDHALGEHHHDLWAREARLRAAPSLEPRPELGE